MSVNQQAQAALDQAKKLTDDANAVQNKALADAKAIVATTPVATTPVATTPVATLPGFNPIFVPQGVQSNQNKKEDVKQQIVNTPPPKNESTGKYVYSVFHTVMSIVAIFLSYRCNGCFQWIPFLVALCCPYAYIIYIIVFKSQCFSTSFIEPTCGPDVVYVQSPQYPSYGYTAPPSYGYNAPPTFNYPPPAPMPPTI